jgi:hypothetical protein
LRIILIGTFLAGVADRSSGADVVDVVDVANFDTAFVYDNVFSPDGIANQGRTS